MMDTALQIPSATTFKVPCGLFIYSYGWGGEPHYIGSSKDVTRIGTTLADAVKTGRHPRMTFLDYSVGMIGFPQVTGFTLRNELTCVENLLVALNGWINKGLRNNGIQNKGKRKCAYVGGENGTQPTPLEFLINYFKGLTNPYGQPWTGHRDLMLQELWNQAVGKKNAGKHLLSKHPERKQWPAMLFDEADSLLQFAYCSKAGKSLHPTGNKTTPRPTPCWVVERPLAAQTL